MKIETKLYSPEEISSYIIALMKKTAEDYYGEDVKQAVITVPAWFNDTQRQATKLAGELAGLEVLRIINEPTAAILSSNIKVNDGEEKTVAVVDTGCGTTDVSVCTLSKDEGSLVVEVLASYGDVFLGGQNFDNAIVEWIIEEFKKEHKIDLKKDKDGICSYCYRLQKRLSVNFLQVQQRIFNEPYITATENGPLHLTMTLTPC